MTTDATITMLLEKIAELNERVKVLEKQILKSTDGVENPNIFSGKEARQILDNLAKRAEEVGGEFYKEMKKKVEKACKNLDKEMRGDKGWIYCGHPNEKPRYCICPMDCICRKDMCKNSPQGNGY